MDSPNNESVFVISLSAILPGIFLLLVIFTVLLLMLFFWKLGTRRKEEESFNTPIAPEVIIPSLGNQKIIIKMEYEGDKRPLSMKEEAMDRRLSVASEIDSQVELPEQNGGDPEAHV
jgi:hypothetical protein